MTARPSVGAAATTERELLITRFLDAPPELVFAAWTDPEQLSRWWGPTGFTTPSVAMDVRPGGAWRICMRDPEGTDHWVRGVYREVVPPQRLVSTWAWEGEDGSPGLETVLSITLEPVAGGTRLTLSQSVFGDVTERDNHHQGWSASLDCLAAALAEVRR